MARILTLDPGACGFDTASSLTAAVLDAAKADGIAFISKYVPYQRSTFTSKFWTSAEIEGCFARDIAALGLFEINETRALGGQLVGLADGVSARASMRALGYPDDLHIVSCVDFDVWSQNSAAVLAYVRAFASAAGGGIAVYGDEDVADGLVAEDAAVVLPNAWGWSRSLHGAGLTQAQRAAAASLIPGVVMYQYPSLLAYGIRVDPLFTFKPLRVWSSRPIPVPVPPPDPTPAPAPTPQEDVMATARITVEGRNAQFYGTGTKLPDGSVHCVFVTWSGPGDDPSNHFIGDHGAAPDIVDQHYTADTVKRDLVLLGDPAEIQDSLHAWSRDDFFRCS